LVVTVWIGNPDTNIEIIVKTTIITLFLQIIFNRLDTTYYFLSKDTKKPPGLATGKLNILFYLIWLLFGRFQI